MSSLKIGIIGLFIVLPFLFVSLVQVRQGRNLQQSRFMVEKAAERAMRDGVFALKTYSRSAYDADQRPKIEIAEKETIDSINRSFAYGLNAKTESRVDEICQSIRLIGLVGYDHLILYDQKTQERLEIPFYQMTIRDKQILIEKRDITAAKQLSGPGRELKTEAILEAVLQPYVGEKRLLLPEHRSALFGNDYSDVGVFILIQGDPLQIGVEENYFKIGKVSLSQRKGLD